MLVIAEVVVDVDPHRLDVSGLVLVLVLVRVLGQGSQGRLVQSLEGLSAVAGQLLERLVVQGVQQEAQGIVLLPQREESLVS